MKATYRIGILVTASIIFTSLFIFFVHTNSNMKLTADFNFNRNIPADKKPLPASHCYSDPLEDQYNAVTMDSNQTYHYIMNMCSNYTEASYRSCKVPKIVHLVPGRRFKFHHYLNIKAIKKIIKPDRIYVHGEIFPFSSKFFMDAVHVIIC